MSEFDQVQEVDALVVGAGMGGIMALQELTNQLDLDAHLIEKAPGIGGTWYWNRYPGALSDTQSFMYQLPYDKELYQQVDWKSRYVQGPDIRKYLEQAVDFWALRGRIQLETSLVRADYDELAARWTVETDKGTFRARFLVTSVGLLSQINVPDFPGIDQFEGQIVHTAAWPENLDIAGKRIAVIGNGSTGVQFMTEASKTVSHLVSFQRTPQYTVPAGNREWTDAELQHFKDTCEERWEEFKTSKIGFGVDETTRLMSDVTPEEREAIFEWAWQKGGNYTFATETFADVTANHESNKYAADFIRRKIAEIVKDPETARKLTPWEIYARRPICDSGYYDMFNKPNVELVSTRDTPITNFVAGGAVTEDGTVHEFDILVMATGFDAVEGSYRAFDVHGKGGETLKEHWGEAPSSHLGVTVSGFPNMFMILGPNGPFVNNPSAVGIQAKWISKAIKAVVDSPNGSIELRPEAEKKWLDDCLDALEGSLFLETGSWIFGSNIPGKRKPRTANFYVGGLDKYLKISGEEADAGFPSYIVRVPSSV